jgi:hypothetical protein
MSNGLVDVSQRLGDSRRSLEIGNQGHKAIGTVNLVLKRTFLLFARRCFKHLALGMVLPTLLLKAQADTLVTPKASPEAQSLFAFLENTYGKKIISGQQEDWRGKDELGFELKYIHDVSGKLPVLLAMDLSAYTRQRPSRARRVHHDVVNHAVDWYSKRNGIISLCWHWAAPMYERAFYTKETKFNPARAATEGTPEYAATIRDIDLIAGELKLLRDARVPVLWRPLHEANGRWFWWGGGGPEPFKKLWRIMFDRLTVYHQLNNLIWVFSPGAAIDLGDWYPGDAYVDIIAPDHYPMDGNNGPAKGIFDEMVALSGGTKLVGFGENGSIPAPEQLVRENVGWLFFIAWSGRTLTDRHSKEQLRQAYNHSHVLNLGDLPDLKKYPSQPTGEPVKLAFIGKVGDLAVGSPGWRPIVVAVQDAAGQTVRDHKYEVTLKLGANPPGAELSGTRSNQTVNGLAIFPDLQINRAGTGFTFQAEARRLTAADSASFRVGPGAGLTYECWIGDAKTAPIIRDKATSPAVGLQILGRAFEMPVRLATNFNARCRGFLLPPLTGDYVFWIATDSNFQMWLSRDEFPENKFKIAEATRDTPYAKWPHTHEVQSQSVRLEAGKRYYLEARQRQNAGSTHFSVRWRLPDGAEERPIPGARFTASEN